MPGFIALVRDADFLAVVAERADQAEAIAEALPVHWRMPPELPDMASLRQTLKDHPSTPRPLDQTGNFARGIGECDVARERTYVWPYHEHGSIGPSCAIADWAEGQPSSGPARRTRTCCAVIWPCWWICRRRPSRSAAIRRPAAMAATAPTMCAATRCCSPCHRPAGARAADPGAGASVGAQGRGAADGSARRHEGGQPACLCHRHLVPVQPRPQSGAAADRARQPRPRPSDMGDRTIIPPYRVPNKRITVHDMAPMVRAAWMRGVSALPNTFAHESFIDEMAFEAEEDPVDFRLRHLDDPRQAELVRRTAAEAGWSARSGPRLRARGAWPMGRALPLPPMCMAHSPALPPPPPPGWWMWRWTRKRAKSP
ncbi:hypothetical protein V6L77_01405 [Pannonibacter sp. Pt2-lr]